MDTSDLVVGVLSIEKVRQVRPHANGAPVAVNVGVAVGLTATKSPKVATGPVPAHASSELQASGAPTLTSTRLKGTANRACPPSVYVSESGRAGRSVSITGFGSPDRASTPPPPMLTTRRLGHLVFGRWSTRSSARNMRLPHDQHGGVSNSGRRVCVVGRVPSRRTHLPDARCHCHRRRYRTARRSPVRQNQTRAGHCGA